MDDELITEIDMVALADEDGWFESPDDVSLVTEVADMLAVFAAQRLERVDRFRRNALADAARYGGGVVEVVHRSLRLELAAALRITEHAAQTLLTHAEALVHRYPGALASLGEARITERHAQILAELLDDASTEVRERITGRAVELAEQHPVGTFRRALRRLIDTEESATLTQRHEAALTQRRVVIEPAADGMAWLHALLPAVEAHAIHARLTGMGKALTSHPDNTRTLDQTRADVLGDLLIDGDTGSLAPEARGIRATVAVTVPALTLLTEDATDANDGGATATDDSTLHRSAPATVEGLGPIPLATAKELCGGADGWMRILTHPETGMVLSVGRTQYRPPPALRRLVKWRADTCMAPGCTIPASRCEIDHTIAWHHGGPTSLDNHAPLCTGHHTIKHHGGWTVEQIPDSGGALLWTSPSGRRYRVEPERRVPVFRPSPHPADAGDAPF